MASLNSLMNHSISPLSNLQRKPNPRKLRIASCLPSETPTLEKPKAINPKPMSDKTKEIIEKEAKYMVGTYARAPIAVKSGKGCKLYDFDGKEYLDMAGGIAVNSLGHCDEDLLNAMVDQARQVWHTSNSLYTLPQVELAERLVKSSFADRVFFTNSGTEANEAAIKFARKFQRHSLADAKEPATEFIAFSNSFHGRTMGAVALTSKEQYRLPFSPVMPGVTSIEYGNIQAVKKAVILGKTAAIFVEPIQGEGGINSATIEFLQALRSVCDEAEALLIFDEVQCGLGRTGRLWAHEAYNVFPDIMTLAKPLAGGLPIGACLVTEKVAAAINYGDHGSTFAGNPIICNIANAAFDKFEDPNFLASVVKKGEYLKKLLHKKLEGNQHVIEVRGVGLIVGVELDVPAAPLVEACRDLGLLILTSGKGNVVRMVPPLIISEEELEFGTEVIKKCMPSLDA